jgi:dTMP kinase
MRGGKFITLEGGEGAGKSTQAERLVAFLENNGCAAVKTREVGGSPGAEEIRNVWLGKGEGFWDPTTELMLVMAARRDHLVKTVWPQMDLDKWVVSDRFVDSTRVYQGVGLGLGLEKVDELYRQIADNFWPDLTLFLDVPVGVGHARVAARAGADDRYQQRDLSFHQTLRSAYRQLAEKEPKRIKIVLADGSADEVAASVQRVVALHFGFSDTA